jgi:putative nucleotidyltransferase with HDIG domain
MRDGSKTMLKRIEKQYVQPGMFLEDLEGSWNDNPFQRRRFLLETDAQVVALLQSNIGAVVINTALGLDVPAPTDIPVTRRGADFSTEERIQIAADFISKSEEVVAGLFQSVRGRGHISLEQVHPIVRRISNFIEHDPLVFLNVSRLKLKDETTFRHSIGVSALAMQFGRYIKLDDKTVQLLGVSGLLHDVGKMEIPNEILTKTGKLTEPELTLVQRHPVLGHKILSTHGDMPKMVLDVCLQHHERLDGKGYPNGLTGKQISLPVRICTICDVFEAITSVRPYKPAWSTADAIAWMLDRRGLFDRALVREFVACLELMAKTSTAAAIS